MALSTKNASFWGRSACSQNTQKSTILGLKNDTKSWLLIEIGLRRCCCVAHIPGYQKNTLESILEPLLDVGDRFFKKWPTSHILAHFGSFLTIWTTLEPLFVCKSHKNGTILFQNSNPDHVAIRSEAKVGWFWKSTNDGVDTLFLVVARLGRIPFRSRRPSGRWRRTDAVPQVPPVLFSVFGGIRTYI